MGMTPRYSLEKAKRIKEEREFQREVAQLQADAKRDLSSDETEEREKVPPKKPGNIVSSLIFLIYISFVNTVSSGCWKF